MATTGEAEKSTTRSRWQPALVRAGLVVTGVYAATWVCNYTQVEPFTLGPVGIAEHIATALRSTGAWFGQWTAALGNYAFKQALLPTGALLSLPAWLYMTCRMIEYHQLEQYGRTAAYWCISMTLCTAFLWLGL